MELTYRDDLSSTYRQTDYSQWMWDPFELRERILDMYAAGKDYKAIGRELGVPAWKCACIRKSWLDKNGVTKPRKGNICTVVVRDKFFGRRLETGQFRLLAGGDEVIIWDPVDECHYHGPIVEILFAGEDTYYWQHPMLHTLSTSRKS